MVIIATFDFGRGREKRWVKQAEPITQLWRFPWRRKYIWKWCFADAVATRWHNTSGSGCDLYESEYVWLKITDFSYKLVVVQSKSKSVLMASCVLEEFDYQQGANLSFSLPDGTRFFIPAVETTWRITHEMDVLWKIRVSRSQFDLLVTRTGSCFSPLM